MLSALTLSIVSILAKLVAITPPSFSIVSIIVLTSEKPTRRKVGTADGMAVFGMLKSTAKGTDGERNYIFSQSPKDFGKWYISSTNEDIDIYAVPSPKVYRALAKVACDELH